ncbi:MAG TPA: PAS domain-containing protein [Candidatus Angelobacter sp.]|nr:PAS domain-containing protein [Candidatus Angelobacter sp.]
MKLWHNPLVLKLALAVAMTSISFLLGALFIRKMRKSLVSPAPPRPLAKDDSTMFTLAAYDSVIRQLQKKEKDLEKLRLKDREQAAINESISDTVLSNLSSGVVFFDRAGAVRQINRAAKSLLGYASPFMFHYRDLFRGIGRVRWLNGQEAHSVQPFLEALRQTIREGSLFQTAEVEYRTPGGQKRVLNVTASPVRSKEGEILGVACLLEDLTEVTELSRQVERFENLASIGEISATIARDMRNSLVTIADYARSLKQEQMDKQLPEQMEYSRELAGKITVEVESLSRVLSEFLEFAKVGRE